MVDLCEYREGRLLLSSLSKSTFVRYLEKMYQKRLKTTNDSVTSPMDAHPFS